MILQSLFYTIRLSLIYLQSEWIKKLPQIFEVIYAYISDFGTFFKTSETFGFIFSSFCVNHSTVLATLGLPPMFSQIVFTDILVAQLVKNSPAIMETWVWSLGWKDPLKKRKATHSGILPWRIPWTVQPMGSQRVRYDWETFTFTFSYKPLPLILPFL